jgi:hypothetical protein
MVADINEKSFYHPHRLSIKLAVVNRHLPVVYSPSEMLLFLGNHTTVVDMSTRNISSNYGNLHVTARRMAISDRESGYAQDIL